MIDPKLKREIEKMVHKRSPQFFMKLMARLLAEKQARQAIKTKKKKHDNLN